MVSPWKYELLVTINHGQHAISQAKIATSTKAVESLNWNQRRRWAVMLAL